MSSALPTMQEAASLQFSELAKLLRSFVEGSKKLRPTTEKAALAQDLCNVLADIIPVSLPPPQPAPLEVPVPPKKPLPPARLQCTLPEYTHVRREYNNRIQKLNDELGKSSKKLQKIISRSVTKISKERDEALARIALSQQPASVVERWLSQKNLFDGFKDEVIRYNRLKKSYDQRQKLHLADLAKWRATYEGPSGEYNTYQRIVEHLKTDVMRLIDGTLAPEVQKLWWRFLPPGENGMDFLGVAVNNLQKNNPHLKIDDSRIHFAQALKPTHIFVGEDEFQGYFAFVFERSKGVLLDNPIEGNAAYIFFSDWKELSRLPKLHLLKNYPDRVERVIHGDTGIWQRQIRRLLRL